MFSSGAFGFLFDYLLWWVLYVSLLVHTWVFFRCFPRARLKKTALVLGNGLVFLCFLGTIALAAESYLRFTAVWTDSFGVSLPARRWFAIHTKLNAMGCRDHEWVVPKPEGVRRIAFVGDSFTYGWGVEKPQDRFTDRLQVMFDAKAKGTIEVMNVAKPGWDTSAEIQPVKDMVVSFGVDEVVLCYVPNDIEKILPMLNGKNPTRPPEPKLLNLDTSCLLDFLYRRVWLPRVPTVAKYHDWLADGFADAEIWKRHQSDLGRIIAACKEKNVTLRVALLPFLHTSGEKYQAERLHQTLRAFFETNHVEVVDLLSAVAGRSAGELDVSRIDAHPNATAHALFAQTIQQAFYPTP